MITKKDGIAFLEKVEEDEPVFILRAKDKIAPVIVGLYALQLTVHRINVHKVDEVREIAQAMREWQEANKTFQQ